MQSGVDALIPVDVHLDFFSLQRIAIRRFVTLRICPDHIVLLARRNALRELAIAIGIQLPARLLFILAANLDFHSVDRMVVRTPDRAEDYSVGFLALVLRRREATR